MKTRLGTPHWRGRPTARWAGGRWPPSSACWPAPQGRVALLSAGLMVLMCGSYVYAQEQRNGVPVDVTSLRNPLPPDERSLAAGREFYQTDCAACHGQTGRGDGPASTQLTPQPADLRVHMAFVHTDGQLFYWVSFGVQGTAMPAWQGTLSEEQRWDLINYIRTFCRLERAVGRSAPVNRSWAAAGGRARGHAVDRRTQHALSKPRYEASS